MLKYVGPLHRPWYINLAIAVILSCAAFTLLQWVERKTNPAGFDLEMQYRIQENTDLSKQSFEVWKEQSPD